MSRLLRALKHFSISVLVIAVALVGFGLAIGADAHLFESPSAYVLSGETHVFLRGDTVSAHVIRGDNDRGFRVDTIVYAGDTARTFPVLFPGDSSTFTVRLADGDLTHMAPPDVVYADSAPIVALSDIEGGFGALRQFLVAHKIADAQMRWTFGTGHLVLVGDFVDRGASVTQVLWAIYALEQSAKAVGGRVHFIVGNHEIKNLQDNFQTAEEKYFHIAAMLGMRQDQLLGDNALLGRWLASKNVLEIINGVAFVHGGLHPDLAKHQVTADDINRIVRASYRTPYFTPVTTSTASFLNSVSTGPAWYRGYFKDDDLTQADVERGLRVVGAKAVVVGHTLQGKVNARFNNTVFAIDVPHRKDYLTSFPPRSSEGLRIANGTFSRLLEDGGVRALR